PPGDARLVCRSATAAGLLAAALHQQSAPGGGCRRPDRLDRLLLAGKTQHAPAAQAGIASPPGHQSVALRSEGHVLGAGAAVQIAGTAPPGYLIVTPAQRRQPEQAGHQPLPFLPVGPDALAIEGMGQQMGCLMGHGLPQEILGVLPIQLPIETQQIAIQIGHAGLLSAKVQGYLRAGKGAVEMALGELVALFESVHYEFHGAHYTGRWAGREKEADKE